MTFKIVPTEPRAGLNKDYPHIETIPFEFPLNSFERSWTQSLIRRAFDIAGINDMVLGEETHSVDIGFRTHLDAVHFEIAYDVPLAYFSRVTESDMSPVSLFFFSLAPKDEQGQRRVNDPNALMIAFETAALKSETTHNINFEKINSAIAVKTPNPLDYFRFWKAIPGPLRQTLYLPDSLSPA